MIRICISRTRLALFAGLIAWGLLPGLAQAQQARFADRSGRTSYVAVLGEVHRPGVYELPTTFPDLADVIARAGGLTPVAAQEFEIIRNGRVSMRTYFSPGARVILIPGDVVRVNRHTPAGRGEPQAAGPRQIALVSLPGHPVVLRVRPEHASPAALVQLLGQSPDVQTRLRVLLPPGYRNAESAAVLPEGTVLVFDPASIDERAIPPLPEPIGLHPREPHSLPVTGPPTALREAAEPGPVPPTATEPTMTAQTPQTPQPLQSTLTQHPSPAATPALPDQPSQMAAAAPFLIGPGTAVPTGLQTIAPSPPATTAGTGAAAPDPQTPVRAAAPQPAPESGPQPAPPAPTLSQTPHVHDGSRCLSCIQAAQGRQSATAATSHPENAPLAGASAVPPAGNGLGAFIVAVGGILLGSSCVLIWTSVRPRTAPAATVPPAVRESSLTDDLIHRRLAVMEHPVRLPADLQFFGQPAEPAQFRFDAAHRSEPAATPHFAPVSAAQQTAGPTMQEARPVHEVRPEPRDSRQPTNSRTATESAMPAESVRAASTARVEPRRTEGKPAAAAAVRAPHFATPAQRQVEQPGPVEQPAGPTPAAETPGPAAEQEPESISEIRTGDRIHRVGADGHGVPAPHAQSGVLERVLEAMQRDRQS